jgi:soluble lytic murein transglycosylase
VSLLRLGFDSAGVALTAAEALSRSGRDRDALKAYQAYGRLRAGAVPRDVKLAQVRTYLALRNPAAALALLDSLGAVEDSVSSPAALIYRSRALAAMGRVSDARAMQDSLIARYPDRPESVEILFLRADARQDRGDLKGAIEGFEAAAALSPAQNLAGQARMRLGQIHLTRGRQEEAVGVYRAYLEAFPDGRRWDEAAFWAGRGLLSLGREEEGRAVLIQLKSRFALSYYALQSGALLGLAYDPEIPPSSSPPPVTEQMVRGLARVDALIRSDLPEGAAWEVETLADSIREVQDPEVRRSRLLGLALELNRRGLTREGINLGWEIRRLGGSWDRDLLSVIYPFPFREMIHREAGEWGLDPYLMAGLMRQESAFWREARSRADARGLMQVLPSTGRELARARGPRAFRAESHLYRPEINIHLGMSFFADLKRRFGDDLSLVLSAYNAGPSRALRWREYPEAGDLVRFVERIPFTETRGYVKNVLLNREIYAWLYGQNGDPDGTIP